MERRSIFVAVFVVMMLGTAARAEPISVRHIQRPMHRFMVARSEAGTILATGEFSQVVQGDEVTMRLTYRFVDGSIDDETTTYRQEGTFRLVRNHHIQKGPFFAKPIDFAVEAATGTVTTRTTDKNSKIHAESEHMDMLDAQAFKRACSCFGLGRYLYRFEETWVQLNRRGEPAALPALPEWALPPGVTVQQAGGKPVDVRGPVDHRLTAEIESFLSTLGVDIYQEILRRTGHSNNARTIPNADRQKNVVEWMEAAARGFERLHGLVEIAGDARFIATMDNLKFSTTTCLPSLAALKRLIDELESITGQQVA